MDMELKKSTHKRGRDFIIQDKTRHDKIPFPP